MFGGSIDIYTAFNLQVMESNVKLENQPKVTFFFRLIIL